MTIAPIILNLAETGVAESSLPTTQTFQGAYLNTFFSQTTASTHFWRITRKDGIEEFYTDADEDITAPFIGNDGTYGLATFVASVGIESSATQRESGLKSENFTMNGAIGGLDLTALEGGRYDFAEVTMWQVDARWPGLPWEQVQQFRLNSTQFDGEQWSFELEGHGQRAREAYGNPFTRTCVWSLGRDDLGNANAGCGRDRTGVGGVHIQIANFSWAQCKVKRVAPATGTNDRMSFTVHRKIETAVSDGAWGTPSGSVVTITSAGANFPTIAAGEYFSIEDHSNAANNGAYQETGGTPTTSSITATKVSGAPVAAAAEAITFITDQPFQNGVPTTMLLGRPYRYGRVIWTSGSNAGLEYDIADYDESVAVTNESGQFSLQRYAENTIVVGDECTIEEGCDGTFETCRSIYLNEQNFGGRGVNAPGTTRSRRAPEIQWR